MACEASLPWQIFHLGRGLLGFRLRTIAFPVRDALSLPLLPFILSLPSLLYVPLFSCARSHLLLRVVRFSGRVDRFGEFACGDPVLGSSWLGFLEELGVGFGVWVCGFGFFGTLPGIMNGASSSEGGPTNLMKESKRPKYTKFTQQELPACKPLLTPGWVMATFMVVGIIFVPIGIVTLLASNSVVEIVHRYDLSCLPPTILTKTDRVNWVQDSATNHNCTISLTVPKKMKQPVYVYYELTNYYQNHRRYVKSRNDQQLRGVKVTTSLDSCKPLATTASGATIIPCGLIAWSLFNDTFAFSSSGSIPVDNSGIAWKSDVNSKFGANVKPSNFPNDNTTGGLGLIGGKALNPDNSLQSDEDLIVWMRTAALPNFRKLWGKITQDLEQGEVITVNIANVYNTYSFKGSKKLVLSTTSWLGGKNSFLGIAYLTVGLICMFLALVFFLIHLKNPRPLGDTSYLSWNKKNNADRSRS